MPSIRVVANQVPFVRNDQTDMGYQVRHLPHQGIQLFGRQHKNSRLLCFKLIQRVKLAPSIES